MDGVHAALVAELRALRRGRGLLSIRSVIGVGPALRLVCGVLDWDGAAETRRKVAAHLADWASYLPADLRITLLAAFGIDPAARLPFYQDRVRWAAVKINRDGRTVRRRIDEGIDRRAEPAASSESAMWQVPDAWRGDWYTEEVRIALALDLPVAEVFEMHRIVAVRDHLSELDMAVAKAALPERERSRRVGDLVGDVFYGGTLIRQTPTSPDRFGPVLALPQPLGHLQKHEFALRYLISTDQVRPGYLYQPAHRCDLFELRVRFDLARMPGQIWRFADTFPHDVDEAMPMGQILPADDAAEVRITFRQLTPGRAYGIGWTQPHGTVRNTAGTSVP